MAILGTSRRRIAVTGTVRSGKTVFLTSLINHLLEHEPGRFNFAGGAKITNAKIMPVPQESRFNYDGYRDALSRGREWPRKTRDSSHFTLAFNRSDWRAWRSELHFFDFPGERIADAAIAAHADYGQWADFILQHLENFEEYRRLSSDYFEALRRPRIGAMDITAAYRALMWRLYTHYMPMISPSTFLLDLNGGMISGETDIPSRHSGLPPDPKGVPGEFAPLPGPQRLENPETAALFQKNYTAYRKTVVLPLFNDLRRSHALVVLVNIPELLAGGVGRFNDTRKIVGDLLAEYDPSTNTLLKSLWRAMTLDGTRTDRIAFVASQSDLVLGPDRDRLHSLLRQMTKRFADSLGNIRADWFTASAVVSTDTVSGEDSLVGAPMGRENPERGDWKFAVPTLPDAWPEDWNPDAYRFTRVWPRVPKNTLIAPDHNNLDRIFDFLTK
ncbi:MAG: YcjX family protein [Candidatus Hydrogenedentes bacterium]|nr:YcjX family protein [Candidatus Hydrogenedentota bacterium]